MDEFLEVKYLCFGGIDDKAHSAPSADQVSGPILTPQPTNGSRGEINENLGTNYEQQIESRNHWRRLRRIVRRQNTGQTAG
jgi:hypothetical protein